MIDDKSIDIDLLPIGYGEIKITKDKTKQSYSYITSYSNASYKALLSRNTYTEDEEFRPCEELNAELFSQKRLKSYHNVLINHSYMEFEQYCLSIKQSLIIKLKPVSKEILSITLVTIPTKKSQTLNKDDSPDYGKILDSSFDLMLIYDSNLTLKFYNQKAKAILGLNHDKENLAESFEHIHPDDKQMALEIINNLLENPSKEISSDIRVLKGDDDYLVMHFLAKNMLDVEGINGIVVNAINITSRKNTESKMIENQIYLESLFRAIPNLIFVLDYQGIFLDLKSENNTKLAFAPDQFLGKNISVLFPGYISRKVISALGQLKAHEEVTPISYQYRNKSKEIGFYECNLSIIDEEKVLAIVNDVTALKKAEEKLTQNHKLIQKKLDAIVSPEGKLSDLDLSDLVDIDELKDLFQTVNDLTKIPVTLIDKKGNVLFSLGMSNICKDFHLARCKSLDKCLRSNYSNTKELKIGESKLYKCLNSIWNLACPIYVGGEQIASLDICQFRLADDTNNYDELLRHQANIFNFDKKAYIEAYYSLPVLEKEHLLKISSYYRDLLSKITALSYAQIKQARTAKQLKLREKKLREITDNMTDVVYTMDLDLQITYISPSVTKLFGFTPSEYMKRTVEEKVPVSSLKIIQDAIAKGLAIPSSKSKGYLFEFQEYHANGNLIDIAVHANILRDNNNQPIGIIGSIRDITKRKKTEAELNTQFEIQKLLSSVAMQYINIPIDQIANAIPQSLEQFAQFANVDRALIVKYDLDKKTATITNEWCKSGITSILERSQDLPLEVLKEWNEDLANGNTIIVNNTQELPDNDKKKQYLTHKHIKSLINVPLMKEDTCIGFVGFNLVERIHNFTANEITLLKIFANLLVNIENRKSINYELIKEKERATESDNLKSNLLRNISHEFRTPLNGIIGLSEHLKAKSINPEFQQMANMILSSGIRLNYVLDSIMLLTQLESLSEKKIINLEQINLSIFLLSLTELYKEQIEQKGLDLIINIQPNLSVKINDNLLRQAIIHIINNAIKYTKKGSIKISCILAQEGNSVKIHIEDTGIGIPKESQEIIFSDFRQVSEGYNRAYEGCGLGLPIAKRVIELMHGNISLESQLERGSKFTIILPVIYDNQVMLKDSDSDKKNYKKQIAHENYASSNTDKPLILIVEDNKVNQKLATSILKKYYETDSALDGETAITMTTQKKYDIILMDIHLGEGLDGLDVAKIIRTDFCYKQTPIIAVTGYTMLGDKENILRQGCSHYLAKPYTKNQLLEIIEKALNQN